MFVTLSLTFVVGKQLFERDASLAMSDTMYAESDAAAADETIEEAGAAADEGKTSVYWPVMFFWACLCRAYVYFLSFIFRSLGYMCVSVCVCCADDVCLSVDIAVDESLFDADDTFDIPDE